MSILIKGNPKEGTYQLLKTTDGWVLEGMDIAYCGFEIPTPHGRLIDGDLVADMLDSMMAHGTLNRAYDEVMDAPTILEAEE